MPIRAKAMDDPIAKIRKAYPMADKCGDGCRLRLGNLQKPYVLIDMDKASALIEENAKRCDYLFIGRVQGKETTWVAPLELKSGSPDVSEVVLQLRAGARTAEKLLPNEEQSRTFKFRPIVACGGSIKRKYGRKGIRKPLDKIKFHQQNEVVRRIECGDSLWKAFFPEQNP